MIKNRFLSSLNSLQKITSEFNEKAVQIKTTLLTNISALTLPQGKHILKYHDLLLFLCAYPMDKHTYNLAQKELKRIAVFGKQLWHAKKSFPENEGLPFAKTVTRFSPDFLEWLVMHKDLKVEFDSFYNPSLSLNEILNITLPRLLKAETTAGLNNEDLLKVLHIKPGQYIPFLLGQLNQLKEWPLIQELFLERMNLYVKLVPKNLQFSRTFNAIPVKNLYCHHDLLKQFNQKQLINEPLPYKRIPQIKERQQLYKVIKNAMALTVREIDPATFLQEDSMRLYPLERGLTLAIYSMIPKSQLPLETYFGFTFFKNGFPVSYGGVWAFGKMAKLGLNIFEPFRGGESGYILCQLLRVFKQAFGVSYFEIEPYQFGLDNPDGINSGAFWFYYKYGFKPVDTTLRMLAKNEYNKIKTRKNYRSTSKTLLQFTESNIGLNLEESLPLNVLTVTAKVLVELKKGWPNNYGLFIQHAVNKFCKKVLLEEGALSTDEKKVLEELSLFAMAMKIRKIPQLQLMKKMVYLKTKDDYAYQQLLLKFFEN